MFKNKVLVIGCVTSMAMILAACEPSQPQSVQYVQPQAQYQAAPVVVGQPQPQVVVVAQPQNNGGDMLAAGAIGYMLGSAGSRPGYSSGYSNHSTTIVNKTTIVQQAPANAYHAPAAAPAPVRAPATQAYKPNRPSVASSSSGSYKPSRR